MLKQTSVGAWLLVATVSLFCFPMAWADIMPNGLCIFSVGSGGRAHGFIVGRNLVTTAHGAKLFTGEVMCSQNGEFIDVSASFDRKNILVHPAYQNALIKQNGNRHFYDAAVLPAVTTLKSDFVLAEGRSLGEMQIRLKRIGAFEPWQNLKAPGSSTRLQPGDSGSPLTVHVEGDKYIVVGMAMAITQTANPSELFILTPSFKRFVDSVAKNQRTCRATLLRQTDVAQSLEQEVIR